ncbi:AMP-binding protein [Candidatus Parabeggiatoa sp. HSG14]|uniref:AMP-binding protein n=1 Tax=Candidatus Parabeggiatoa sp. HSG14 TaxID=3055593 RepID=UPI0025A7D31E|nr:AMP-binding protein [Thiotrichales bacterium HSG14]
MFTFTIYDLLAKNLVENANHIAVVSGNAEISYGELGYSVDIVAKWLHENGVKRGDRVGIYLPKSIEEIVATFAISRIGAVFVNINYQWTHHQLAYVLNDCNIKVLFTDKRQAQNIDKQGLIGQLDHLIIKGKVSAHPKMISWTELSDTTTVLPNGPIDVDLAALLYTSGSTGSPKGVMLTHKNIIEGARSVACYLGNTPDDRILGLLPMSFDYGMSQMTTMFLVGGTLVLQPVVMPTEIIKTLISKNVTGMAAVPPTWLQVVRYLQEVKTELPALRYITNSGGSIPQIILETMPQVFQNVDIYLMYGLTEAFRSTYLPPALFHEKRGAIGKAIPNAELYVVDNERNCLCNPGEPGELVHRGSLISLGYWRKSEITAEKIKSCQALKPLIGDEKVLYSGDIVRVDEDGILWFVNRSDSMIKSSGFRISPTEVEDIVYQSNMVGDTVAFGVKDESLGQVVHIAVSPVDKNGTVDREELIRYCRLNMPNYMIPSQIHLWIGLMPRTSSGKIDRPMVINTCIEKEQ